MPSYRTHQTHSAVAELKKTSLHYGGILFLIILLISGVFWWQLPPEIPLFYSKPYGLPQLSQKIWFLLFPGLSLVAFLVTFGLLKIQVKSHLYKDMLAWLLSLYLFLIIVAMIHIILVVL